MIQFCEVDNYRVVSATNEAGKLATSQQLLRAGNWNIVFNMILNNWKFLSPSRRTIAHMLHIVIAPNRSLQSYQSASPCNIFVRDGARGVPGLMR